MAIHSEETRAMFLRTMLAMLGEATSIFQAFREDCEVRKSAYCSHKDYVKDTFLPKVCHMDDCPLMVEEN